MAWQSGGGGGYPGVTSDGSDGLVVARALQAGDASAAVFPDLSQINGELGITDTLGNLVDGDEVFHVTQIVPMPVGGLGESAVIVTRAGNISNGDYSRPTVKLEDATASAQPVVRVIKQGTTVLELSTIKSVTGALSTVTDAAAKAVLTSILATLTGIKVATDNTT